MEMMTLLGDAGSLLKQPGRRVEEGNMTDS